MPLPLSFQIALKSFDLGTDSPGLRAEVWTLLAAKIGGIADQYIEKTARAAPYYRKTLLESRSQHRDLISTYTERLFKNPFDEVWVADTKERVTAEIDFGYDLRARAVMAQTILTSLSNILSERHPFSGRKTTRIMEMATRVLLLDVVNAAAFHHNVAVRQARAYAGELDSAISSFDANVRDIRHSVAASVASLTDLSKRMTEMANEASAHSAKGAFAANAAAEDAREMASSTDQLSASIQEIQGQTTSSAVKARDAASSATDMKEAMQLLVEAMTTIRSFSTMIAGIASQTNLLALNASIEAASAGEKGKGFGVVAAEVKSLANQTFSAIKHIDEQARIIEDAISKSIEAINDTHSKIGDISSISQSLQDAVTEQAKATNSIAKGVSAAASNANQSAEALNALAPQIETGSNIARAVLDFTKDLSDQMSNMNEAMDTLLQAWSRQAHLKKFVDLASDKSEQPDVLDAHQRAGG